MSPGIALVVLAGLLLVAVLAGVALAARTGRVRRTPRDADDPGGAVDPGEFGVETLGRAGTVIQFSTVYCTRCPATRRMIDEAVGGRDDVAIIHADVTEEPRLVAAYRLAQTPTVLILDPDGRIRSRLSGPISRAALDTELASIIGGTA